MNPLAGLTEYLHKVEKSLRFLTLTRGAAVVGGAALVVTVALVLIANQFAFSNPSVFWSRVLLFLAVAGAICAGLVVPLLRLNRRRAAKRAEQRYPEFQERLLTFTEKSQQNAADPFLPLLAADALDLAKKREHEPLVPKSWLISFGSAAAVAVTVLLWLGISGPGFMGYGTALLWGGYPKEDRKPIYSIRVDPGSRRIRRRSDQVINASLSGFTSNKVSVFARYASSTKWEEAPMQPQPHSSNYSFLFAGVPEDVEYYISAGGVRSDPYRLTVVDLPGVKKLRVTYHYPSWLGLKNQVEDPGGDLRAVQGAEAEVEVETDKPLAKASLVLDSGQKIDLDASGGKLLARVPIQKDDMYHVATPDGGEMVRLTENYFIEARADAPPAVSILKPGKDAKVSPIEEVAVTIQGKDDFGLHGLDLHYSVNGGPEQTVSVLDQKGRKEADGSTTIYLEEHKLVPGDIISLYASAKDARNTTKTDIFFIEAQPFEKEYSQSQQMGGAGGGQQQDQNNISQRQKELISATWNELKRKGDKASSADNAKYLADVQAKLRDQAQSLANRMKARQMTENNPAFKTFTEDMQKAIESMGPASDELRGQKWQDALTPEQKALQYLLRAEATFRQIQVAFGRQGGGGGGGQSGASRDLENMFDLELDTEKNQYESNQQSAAEQQQKQIDEALQKLQELARRQQELASQPRNNQQNFQQRWQQEMLRREAEELRRQLQQMQQNQQGQQSSSGQSSSSQSGQSGQQQSQQNNQNQQGRPGQQQQNAQQQQNMMRRNQLQGAQARQLEEAINRLNEATREMSSANSSQSQQQNGQPNGQQGAKSQGDAQADARRAAERLQEAQNMLNGLRNQQSGDEMGNLSRQAERLAGQQESFEQRMRKNFGSGQGADPPRNQQLSQQMSEEKQQEIDDLSKLEKDMQQAARNLQQSQPDVSKKLRDALGAMQQEELASRMKLSQDYLRRGLAPYAVMREAPVTQGMNDLRDSLRRAEEALNKNKQQPGAAGDDKNLQQAIAEAERLRQQIEQMARANQNGREQQGQQQRLSRDGQQNGQQQNGQQQGGQQQGGQQQGGQQQGGQQQGGQQQGGQQQGGQQAGGQQQGGQQPGGQQQGGGNANGGARGGTFNGGSWGPYGGYGQVGPDWNDRAYSDAVRDLSRLQQAARDNPEIARQLQDFARQLQNIAPNRFPGDPELLQKIMNQMLGDMEQVELSLRRKADGTSGNPHVPTPQNVPQGYANAVAEYFKRLSKEK